MFIFLLAACGSDDGSDNAAPSPSTAADAGDDQGVDPDPGEAVDSETAATTDEAAAPPTETTAATDEAPTSPQGDPSGPGSGNVSTGNTLYQFDSAWECSISPGDVVTVSTLGTAVDGTTAEIYLESFESGKRAMRIIGPNFEWLTVDDDFTFIVNDPDITGSAEVFSPGTGEVATSLISINCS